MRFAKKMGQIAHFWPPEWLIQSSPPPIEGHHRQQDNQCKDPMDNNKDCAGGEKCPPDEGDA